MLRRPPTSTLFPSTTLFRSVVFANSTSCAKYVERKRERDTHTYTEGERERERKRERERERDRKSTRLNSSHGYISYAVFCLKKKINIIKESEIDKNAYTVIHNVRLTIGNNCNRDCSITQICLIRPQT